jgi:hypothetical protein
MPRSSTTPDATRAAALADLHAGEQPAIVAERYGLNPDTVRQWKTRFVTESVTAVTNRDTIQRPALERQKQRLGELLLGLLAAKLEASQAIAKVASDPAWLKKQHAADLAELVRTLDATALALGDRLAGSSTDPADSGDSG